MCRPHGDNMETTWGEINDLLRHPHLWVGVWVVGWMGGFICESMGGVTSYN